MNAMTNTSSGLHDVVLPVSFLVGRRAPDAILDQAVPPCLIAESQTDRRGIYSSREAWFVYRTSTTLLSFSRVCSAASYDSSRCVSS